MSEEIIHLVPNTDGKNWWCKTHKRRATHIYVGPSKFSIVGEPHCAPLSGILMPCFCVERCDKCTVGEAHNMHEGDRLVMEGDEDQTFGIVDDLFDFCPYCGRSFKEEPPRTKKEMVAQRKAEKV